MVVVATKFVPDELTDDMNEFGKDGIEASEGTDGGH